MSDCFLEQAVNKNDKGMWVTITDRNKFLTVVKEKSNVVVHVLLNYTVTFEKIVLMRLFWQLQAPIKIKFVAQHF